MSIFLKPDQSLDKPVSGSISRGSAGKHSLPKIGFWTVEQHPRIVLVGLASSTDWMSVVATSSSGASELFFRIRAISSSPSVIKPSLANNKRSLFRMPTDYDEVSISAPPGQAVHIFHLTSHSSLKMYSFRLSSVPIYVHPCFHRDMPAD